MTMQGSSVTDATNQLGIHISLPYQTRYTDEAFRAAWKEAAEIGTEFLEHEAARRAYHGTLEPVFYKGVICGNIRRYSDTLLMFLLKGRKPEVYREGIEDGSIQRGVTLNVQVVNVEKPAPPAIESVGIPQEDGGGEVFVEVVSATDGSK